MMKRTRADLQANYVLLLQEVDRLRTQGQDAEAEQAEQELTRVGEMLYDEYEVRFEHSTNMWVSVN